MAVVVACIVRATPIAAQETPADTADVLVELARSLETEGRTELARQLLRLVLDRYPDTPAAREAAQQLGLLRDTRVAGSGRVQFVVWNTLFGTWLGLAIPAAFGADSPEPFGAGLLVGGPTGYLASRAYARSRSLTAGQAGAYTLATVWGTWQGLGWQQALNISEPSDEGPWVAMVIGGLTGIGTGLLLSHQDISRGGITLADHAALWGTWYGFALGVMLDREDDALWAFTLVGGDVGLAAAVPTASIWRPTPGQVRLTSLAGVAGGVAGLGLDLLLSVEDDATAVAIPTIGATIGLVAGALGTAGRNDNRTDFDGTLDGALLNVRDGLRLGFPSLLPDAQPSLTRDGRVTMRPAVHLRLVDVRF
jgi:hypothetical protein